MKFTNLNVNVFYELLKEQQSGKHLVSRKELVDFFTTLNVINSERKEKSTLNGELLSEYKVGGLFEEMIIPWFIGITGDDESNINLLDSSYSNSSTNAIVYTKKVKINENSDNQAEEATSGKVKYQDVVCHGEFLGPEDFEAVQRRIYRSLGQKLDLTTMKAVPGLRKKASLTTEMLKRYAYNGMTFKSESESHVIPILFNVNLYQDEELIKDVNWAFDKRVTRWVMDTVK